MSDALTIGWTQAQVAGCKRRYRSVLAVNLVLHVIAGLACLFAPRWVADVLNLPGPLPTGWTRGWGATLILVTALYVPGWIDPLTIRSPNLIGIFGRFWMGTVWLVIGGGFLWLAAFEYVFGLLLALLYWRVWRDDLMSYP